MPLMDVIPSGLNTDMPPVRLPHGAGDVATDVDFEGLPGGVQRRLGSSLWTNVTGLTQAGGTLSLAGVGHKGGTFTTGGLVFEFDTGKAATGTISIAAGNITSGKIITIADGQGLDSNGVQHPAKVIHLGTDVAVGGTPTISMASLVLYINTFLTGASFTIAATATSPTPDNACTLANSVVGTAGNITITTNDPNVTVTGMAGGFAAGNDVTAGHVGIAVGATATATIKTVS